jgi:hypothetical protein
MKFIDRFSYVSLVDRLKLAFDNKKFMPKYEAISAEIRLLAPAEC